MKFSFLEGQETQLPHEDLLHYIQEMEKEEGRLSLKERFILENLRAKWLKEKR